MASLRSPPLKFQHTMEDNAMSTNSKHQKQLKIKYQTSKASIQLDLVRS